MTVRPRVFEYDVELDRGGRLTIPGGGQLQTPEGWSADHLLLAALIRCSIDSFAYHARRGGHAVVSAAGSAHGVITQADDDGRFRFVEIDVTIDAQLDPRADDTAELVERGERDCFVGASLSIKPRYEWRVS